MAKHSTLPWTIKHHYDGTATIRGADGRPIMKLTKMHIVGDGIDHVAANADLFMRACNSHDALVEACEDGQSLADDAANACADAAVGESPDLQHYAKALATWAMRARAALADAKKGE